MQRGKFTLDTTSASVDETLEEFISKIKWHTTPQDRLRILTHKSKDILWL